MPSGIASPQRGSEVRVDDAFIQDIEQRIDNREFTQLRHRLSDLPLPILSQTIIALDPADKAVAFRMLPRDQAARTFGHLPLGVRHALIDALGDRHVIGILDQMPPDERTAVLEELPATVTRELLDQLAPDERAIARDLLGYPPDSVGRLMTPEYVAAHPSWTVKQTLAHIREVGADSETLNELYVVDETNHLIDDLRVRELLLTDPQTPIQEIIDGQYIRLSATESQETAIGVFRAHDRVVLPVTDTEGILLGIVTVDDVLDVSQQEATRDIHGLGGSSPLGGPYLDIPILQLIRKRAGWLVLLFISEMLTATAMAAFEDEIAHAVVLALFVPLIISSGGNSGSQAATIITRSLALGEVRYRDWWRVMRREIVVGLSLGVVLGTIGFFRVSIWGQVFNSYGPHWPLVALTIFLSLIGIVLWGSLSGSILPIVLDRLGFDPASASAPFVATLVDVTGIIIYFTVATVILSGTLL